MKDVAVITKVPPMPSISLPIKSVEKESAKAETREPATTPKSDKAPIRLTPYFLTKTPAGRLRKIPGMGTTDIASAT